MKRLDFKDGTEALGGYGNEPASTLVEVSALMHPDMLVEIEAYAIGG